MGVESGTKSSDFSDFFHRTIKTLVRDTAATIVSDVGSRPPQVASSSEVMAHIKSFLYWADLKLKEEESIALFLECASQFEEMDETQAASLMFDSCASKVRCIVWTCLDVFGGEVSALLCAQGSTPRGGSCLWALGRDEDNLKGVKIASTKE